MLIKLYSVLTLLVPAAFFAGIRNNTARSASEELVVLARRVELHPVPAPVSDEVRHQLLQLSRGLAVVLLIGYVACETAFLDPC